MPSKYFGSTDKTLELKDTMKLQKASLDAFSMQLGYWWDEEGGNYFGVDSGCIVRGKMTLSLRKMQQWHNYNFIKEVESFPWHGESVLPEITNTLKFEVEELLSAINSKLVLTTHLQYSKKQSKLLCTNHQIKIAE